MATPRFFCPPGLRPRSSVILLERASHHAVRVLRLGPGDDVVLFDGTGGEYPARILRADRHGAQVETGDWVSDDRESTLAITLVQALCAGDKMDLVLQKAVELGVQRLIPVAAARSVARLDSERSEKRRAHWQGILVAACEQSGRNRVPELLPLMAWGDLWEVIPAGMKLILDPGASRGLDQLALPREEVILLAGPEGGFTPQETADALARGCHGLRLGPRVLRCETAALAALAAFQARWGDFR